MRYALRLLALLAVTGTATVATAGCATITATASVTTAASEESAIAFVPVIVEAIDSQLAHEFITQPESADGKLVIVSPRMRLSQRVAQSLQRAFVGKGPWTVIDRVRTDAVADEMVLQIGEFIDESTRVEFGRRVAARIIVTAFATIAIDGTPTLSADAIFVESGVIVWSAKATGPATTEFAAAYDDLADALAAEILKRLPQQ